MGPVPEGAEAYRREFPTRVTSSAGQADRRPGIKDVAAIAQVSVGTASDALNGSGRVASRTRARVRQVAEAIEYRPSTLARSFRTNKSHTIGLSIRPFGGAPWQYLAVSYYARLLSAATAEALQRGYALIVLPPNTPQILGRIVIDGAIIADPSPYDLLTDELDLLGVPFVSDLSRMDDPAALCVGNDHAAAVTTVCAHFRSQGARSVGMLLSDGTEDYNTRSLHGYQTWCARNGAPVRVERASTVDPVAMAKAADRLMTGPDRPEAVYTTEGPAGHLLQEAARRNDLRVPDDVLLACAEVPVAGREQLDLTTLNLNAEHVAAQAVDLLAQTLEDQHPIDRHRVVDTTLHVRGSSTRTTSS